MPLPSRSHRLPFARVAGPVVIAAVACLTVAAPASASASTSTLVSAPTVAAASATDALGLTPTRNLVAGPALLEGNRIAWLEATDDEWRIRLLEPDAKRPTTVARGGLSHTDDYESGDVSDETIAPQLSVAGDTAVIALGSSGGSNKVQVYEAGTTVTAISLKTGASRTLASCSTHSEGTFSSSPTAAFSTDGAHTVVSLCDKAAIFDGAAQQASPTATLPDVPVRAKIAGAFVATLTGGRLTVRTWADGAAVYSTMLPLIVDRVDFALQDDGAVALVTSTSPDRGNQTQLTWHTAAAPDGTVLPVKPSQVRVSARGGKAIVAVASLSGLGDVLTEIGPAAPELPLAFLGWDAGPDFGYLDGRVAYARGGCDGAGAVGLATGDATPVATDCPDLVVRRAKRTGRRLGVSLSYRQGVTEPLRLTYRAGGRSVRFTIRARQGSEGADATFRLPTWVARKRATLTVTYAGNPLFIRQVASRPVHG